MLSTLALRTIDAAMLTEALHFATSAAAITCSRCGADLLWRAELA